MSSPIGLSLRFLCLLSGILTGCGERQLSAPSQILRVSQRNEPSSLDPATATLPEEFAVLRAVSEGLLIPGSNGHPEPGAALRFDVSADGLIYTFHLRPEAIWSDGEPVTAMHFVDSYRRLLTPATAAKKANVFFPVKNARAFVTGTITDFLSVGFRAIDAHTLVVTLERPTPRFPYYVVSIPWLPVPRRVVAEHVRAWTRPGTLVGNGPFTLEQWRPDQRIIVKKNPRWHGSLKVRLDEIHFLRFDSGDTEERAYRAGQTDVTMAVPFSKIETYTQERPAEVQRAPMIETRCFSFNTRRRPLDDARVRRALALAIDRQKLVERVVRGGQPVASRIVPAALREPTEASSLLLTQVEHRYDPEAARQLFAAAGVAAKDFSRFEITAWSPSQVPVLEAVQQMWRNELGLEFAIAVRDARVHWDALGTGDYDIAYLSAIPDVADIAQILGDYVTGAPDNFPQWSDSSFDDAFERATSIADPASRTEAFLAVERRLLESAPLTPLYFNTKIWVMSPRVVGWQEDGLWARCYHNVYLDSPH